MAIPLTVNGAVFEYPVDFDENWGVDATGWAQAMTVGTLQMAGGSFPLTANVNFGASFGLLSQYFSTRSTNPSTVGTVRLSSADAGIGWRNNANSGNLILTTNASDQLLYNGFPIATSGAGAVTSIIGTANQIIASSPTGAVTLSTPQSIATTSSPTFANLTLTNPLPVASGGTGQSSFGVGALSSNGTVLTSGTLAVTDGGTGTTTSTGTGNVVLSTSPTLVTPALGTPSAAVLTNATGLPLTTGVTGVLPNANTTATSNATASTIVSRDASVNTRVNEIIQNFNTTATSGGTLVLSVTSSPLQQFTGTLGHTVTLPDATTLVIGHYFTVLNRSTGVITVNNNGGSLVFTVPATSQTTFIVTAVGTANGTWDVSSSSGSSVTAYREDYVVGTASGNYTGSLTVFALTNAYSVGGNNLIVVLDGDVQTKGGSADYVETNSLTVTFNNTLVAGQTVGFIFQTTSSSGGTVNSGTANTLAFYGATGPTVSGSAILSQSSAGLVFANTAAQGIVGTTTNDSAAAGNVGQYVEALSSTAVNSAADVTFDDLVSISLTAGDWDIWAFAEWENNGATWTRHEIGISTTSGNSSSGLVQGQNWSINLYASTSATNSYNPVIPPYRVSLSATTTYYLKRRAGYSAGTPRTSGGRLAARRVR